MRYMDKDVVNIGKSVVIKGELSGSEDLVIEGTVEGKVALGEHVLTVGAHGKIKAEVFAKIVIVLGEVVGNITASEKVDIRDSGSVDGDILSPRVAIAEGAHLRGSVDMQRSRRWPPCQPRASPRRSSRPFPPACRGLAASTSRARRPPVRERARFTCSGRVLGGEVLLSGGDTLRSLRALLSTAGDPPRQAEGTPPDTNLTAHAEDGNDCHVESAAEVPLYLGTRPAPILLDLGPVVGSNITFFGASS